MDKVIQLDFRVPDSIDGFDILCLLDFACDIYLYGVQNAHLYDVTARNIIPIKHSVDYSKDNETFRELKGDSNE